MRTIERFGQFKREKKGQHRATLDAGFQTVVSALLAGLPPAPRHRDHAMIGDWKDHRDCHVKPDLVLIYSKPDVHTLRLVWLESHSELGLQGSRTTPGQRQTLNAQRKTVSRWQAIRPAR